MFFDRHLQTKLQGVKLLQRLHFADGSSSKEKTDLNLMFFKKGQYYFLPIIFDIQQASAFNSFLTKQDICSLHSFHFMKFYYKL